MRTLRLAAALALLCGSALAVPSPVTPGGGGLSSTGDASATTSLATGGITAASLAARFGRVLNVVDDCGAPTNGTSDAAPAFAACLAKGVPVIVPAAAGGGPIVFALFTPPSIPSNGKLFCVDTAAVTLRIGSAAHSNVLDITNTTGVEIAGCTIDGNKALVTSDTTPIIRALHTGTAYIHDLTINNPVEGVVLTSSGLGGSTHNVVQRVTVNGANFHGFAFANGSSNLCEDCGGDGGGQFMLWATGTETGDWFVRPWTTYNGIELIGTDWQTSHITIQDARALRPILSPWVTGTAFTAGQLVTNAFNVYSAGSSGTAGATAPVNTSGTQSDGTITWTYVHAYWATGDNCMSIVGNYNTIVGGNLEGCRRNGVALYGDHNTMTGTTTLNVGQDNNHGGTSHYYGADLYSYYGGVSAFNALSSNVFDDTQTTPTQWASVDFQFGYPAWVTATVFGSNVYIKNGANIYSTASGGTSGAAPPTHTTGTVSDGGISWTFVRTTTLVTQANNNNIGANTYGPSVSGQATADTTVLQPNGWVMNSTNVFAGGGNARGQYAVDLQMAKTGANQVAGGQYSFTAGNSNIASNQNGVAIGGNNTVGATAAFALGNANAVGGLSAGAIGNNNSVLGPGSYAVGTLTADRTRRGILCTAHSDFAAAGDAQSCVGTVRQLATAATAVRLTADGLAPSGSNLNCISIPDSTAYNIRISLEARDVTTPANRYTAVWNGAHELARGAGVGTTLFNGVATAVAPDFSRLAGAATTQTASVAADTTNGCLNLTFTPPTGNTDTWHAVARVETVEVQ